jgi:hypothetical protein
VSITKGDYGSDDAPRAAEEKRTVAAPDELRKAYFEGYEDALKDRAAPAEVAEGAPVCPYIVTDKEGTSYCRLAEQVAAPSLSREECKDITAMLDSLEAMANIAVICSKDIESKASADFVTAFRAALPALRAKVREAAKSRP